MLTGRAKILRFALSLAAAALSAAFLNGLAGFYLKGGRFLFFEEMERTITKVSVSCGETISPRDLKDYCLVEEGLPLFPDGIFSLSMERRREFILDRAPTLKSLSIQRKLCGDVLITATERIPLASISVYERRSFAVDSEGTVFCSFSGDNAIPFLSGLPLSLMEPGKNICGQGSVATAAIALLKFIADGKSPFRQTDVKGVDVSGKDFVLMHFADGRTAKIAWQGMHGEEAFPGEKYMAAQLEGLHKSMHDGRSAGYRRFDATIKGVCIGLR